MHQNVESLGHVHGAGKDLAPTPQKIVYSLYNKPGTHVGGTLWLVGKLKIIKLEAVSIEKDDDPINNLEEQTTD